MAVRAEVARSATTYATVSVRDDAPDADFQVAVAKVLAANAYLNNSAENIQIHGGMGFTWECDVHLYVKRARLRPRLRVAHRTSRSHCRAFRQDCGARSSLTPAAGYTIRMDALRTLFFPLGFPPAAGRRAGRVGIRVSFRGATVDHVRVLSPLLLTLSSARSSS